MADLQLTRGKLTALIADLTYFVLTISQNFHEIVTGEIVNNSDVYDHLKQTAERARQNYHARSCYDFYFNENDRDVLVFHLYQLTELLNIQDRNFNTDKIHHRILSLSTILNNLAWLRHKYIVRLQRLDEELKWEVNMACRLHPVI